MRKYKLRNGRHQAQFGADGAIMAAATIAQTLAQVASARQQAAATKAAAKQQADALIEQNNNNNKLQEKSIAFTKQQNEQNRDMMRQTQMTLQMLAGQNNANARLEAAKIQVKNGGSSKRRLNNSASFLRGRNGNLPFIVTDGGGVIPIGTTPEGFDLYEIAGNDHNHYHKTKGGKNKTGVGIKFGTGETIEGEGNQNTNRGELMLVTPNDAKFISKHSIKGFNPRKAVEQGMNPIDAFTQQEIIKNMYGISDDGHNNKTLIKKRRLRNTGGDIAININDPLMHITSDVDNNALTSIATAGASIRNAAKCGMSLRRRAIKGTRYVGEQGLYQQLQQDNARTQGQAALTNGIGATIQSIGSGIAAGIANRATRQAAQSLRDAYNSFRGIDESAVSSKDYQAAHAMTAIQTPYISTGAETAASERGFQRSLKNIRRSNASSAAAQSRMNLAQDIHQSNIGQISSNADKIRQGIIANNINAINQTSQLNAQLDQQARQNFVKDRLQLLMYNNEIANERIRGIGQTNADEYTGIAANTAGAIQNIANNITNSGNQVATNMLAGRQNLNDFRTNAYLSSGRLDTNEREKFLRMLGIVRNGGSIKKHKLTLK